MSDGPTMTQDEFRRLALQMPEATENAHMAHPDFRIGTRIFATLDYPEPGWAMVRLTPEQQAALIAAEPASFSAASGSWGENGATLIRLDRTAAPAALDAITLAYENLERRFSERTSPRRPPV
jgi:hypothetical protein